MQEDIRYLILNSSSVAVFFIAYYHISTSGRSFGALMTFITNWDRFLGLIPIISNLQSLLIKSCFDAQKLLSVMARPATEDNPRKTCNIYGSIAFHGVSFKYQDKKTVVIDLSFQSKRDELITLIGRNGSGKSTILKLISGLYQATNKQITVDNEDLQGISRKNIKTVPQKIQLLNRTI